VINLHGQTAVVTGGGRGLGRAFAQALAAAGASVVIVARTAGELRDTAAAIGSGVKAFPADVSDAAALRSAFADIGPVDLLVNNAGMLGPIGPFWEADFDDWWRTMEVNVRGALLCAHAVLPAMIARRRGRIINVVTSAFPAPYLSPYLASKTALLRATECLAAEAKPHGVSLFSMAPGTVRTEMSMHSVQSAEGQKWIPWFKRIFDERLDVPAERPAQLVLELASGAMDPLSGLFLTPFDDLGALLQNLARIEAEKLYSLRVRPLNPTSGASTAAAIRDAAERAIVPQIDNGSREEIR
jgi:NAD(P)-dependent dehydrogenase (short-subunit alcohol dehydrogenase family)